MKFLVCLLVTLGVAYGAITPIKTNCRNTFCTMDLKICPDGTRAPVPVGGCCPSLSACKDVKPINNCLNTFCTMDLKICPDGTPAPVPAGQCCPSLSACKEAKPTTDCRFVMCTMDLKICPDGTSAPVPAGQCCPSLSACKTSIMSRRSNPLSILSGNNLLQTMTSATHGTNLGTALSILNLLNNIQQLTNDVHQIPVLINQTLSGLVSGAGQAGQVVIDQLVGAINHQSVNRDLLGGLVQNANLLSSVSSLLPQGTSIATVLSILKLLNSVNQLSNDVHQIPVLLNQTLTSLLGGAGQASGLLVQQLLSLVNTHPGAGRDLLGGLVQNANLLSSVSHLLPQGTSITTVIAILKLLNNINQLSNDVHQIPVLLNQTLTSLLGGAGQASELLVQQLLSLVNTHVGASRDLLGALGQNANLLSSVSHLLPQGTSITTVLSLLNLLNNVNALNNDLHQIPTVLQGTLQNLLNGVQNILPPTIVPVQGL